MLKLTLREKYIADDNSLILYYVDTVKLRGFRYIMFFIATPDDIVYDVALFPADACSFKGRVLMITSDMVEKFIKCEDFRPCCTD